MAAPAPETLAKAFAELGTGFLFSGPLETAADFRAWLGAKHATAAHPRVGLGEKGSRRE